MPDRMRVLCGVVLGRAAMVAVLMLASMLLGGVAMAGGPTSVLLVAPDSQRATALYATDPSYPRLMSLLGGEAPTGAAVADTTPGGSRYVTVTWLIHDVTVWRTDRIALDAPDGPWVVTQSTLEGGQFSGAVRHRPTDPAALRSLLSDLGMTGGSRGVTAAPAPGATAPTPPPAPSPGADSSGWWWVLPGLLVGAGATVVALRTSPGVRRRLLADGSADGPALVVTSPVGDGIGSVSSPAANR